MTLEPSLTPTPPSGNATSSAGDSPARTSATPDGEQESTASAPGCGQSLPGSFAFYDREESLWKTLTPSLFAGLDVFSETWPRSGLMRSGIAYRLPPLVLLIFAGESLSLPTPQAAEHGAYQRDRGQKGRERLTLTGLAANGLLPTPSATEFGCADTERLLERRAECQAKYGNNGFGLTLSQHMALMYPTPRADGRDNCGGSNSRRIAKKRGTYIGRKLSPRFVEWMMGFPLGWTDLEGLEMPSSRK